MVSVALSMALSHVEPWMIFVLDAWLCTYYVHVFNSCALIQDLQYQLIKSHKKKLKHQAKQPWVTCLAVVDIPQYVVWAAHGRRRVYSIPGPSAVI